MEAMESKTLPNLSEERNDFFALLRDREFGEQKVLSHLQPYENDLQSYLAPIYRLSQQRDGAYPSQGLLETPYDYLPYQSVQMLPPDLILKTLRMRWYFLLLFNHPYRIHFLREVNKQPFTAPPKRECLALDNALNLGLSLSIGDIGAIVTGTEKERVSRKVRYSQGPFVKLGRQARMIFNGSESPDVWNSVEAVATMAASHCLSNIPRNGVLSSDQRQVDFAKEVFIRLDQLADWLLKGRSDQDELLLMWGRNVMAVLSADSEKALRQANKLYEVGVRAFRIYSPEPGTGPVDTVKSLRNSMGDEIEIWTGNLATVNQAKAAQDAGADGVILGIGGGGRCITGVRSGSVVNWPEVLWKLRGELTIPIIVQGGASDHIAVTLLLGASGIGVSRAVSGGTIESPGGALYFSDEKGRLFKPCGGEASARTKYLDGKMLPFDIPAFVEGEVTKAEMSYVKHALPTLTYNLHQLNEDAILALVFRGVETIEQLHALDPSPLRQNTSMGDFQRNTH